MVAAAAPAKQVQCYVNRATEFGHTVLAFVPPPAAAPANDTEALPARKPTPAFKWIHVANTGTYRGHHQGEFTLDADSFAQMLANFRGDPKYGDPKFAAGVGPVELDGKAYDGPSISRIIQFDYEHASEMAPTEGTIPSGGAPAIGWALELDVRQGEDGRAQLWALAKLGDTIRGQIDRDEYNSVSIAWNPAGVHWITGKPIGAVLTSIAFTNHPFIRDLMPLAAANRAAGLGSAGGVQTRAQSAEAHEDGPLNNQREPMTVSAEFRSLLCRLFGLQPEAADGSIIRAAENATTASNELAGLLKALGLGTAADALSALPDLMGARSRLTELLAQFDALMRADAVADADVESQDVAAAFSSRRFTDGSLVHSLAAHRGSLINGEIGKLPEADRKDVSKVRAARAQGRALFLTHYGVPTNPAHIHLTRTFAAGPGATGGSTQFAPPAPVAAPILQHQPAPAAPPYGYPPAGYPQPGQPLQLSQHPLPVGQQPVDLSAFSGRNQTEQIISYLASTDAAFGKLEHGVQIQRASAWRRANSHLIVGAAA